MAVNCIPPAGRASSAVNPGSDSLILTRVAQGCVLLTLLAHVTVLMNAGLDAGATPISQLSRGPLAWLHSLGLIALAAAWLCLVAVLWHRARGWLWRLGCILILASVPVLLFIAWYFASAGDTQLFGPHAKDTLSVLASTLGIAMGALHRGLRSLDVTLYRVNAVILALWLALIPVIPFIEPEWLGAYERCVGLLMLVWTFMLSMAPRPLPGATRGA